MSEHTPKSLHRLNDNKNDWDDLLPEQMNRWQKVASRTKGIVTAANAITIAGTVLFMNGLSDFASGRKAEGTAKIIGARALDVVDGSVAEATGTKGKVGRALDPGVDYLQLGVALPVLVVNDVLPLAAAVAVGIPKIIDGVATAASQIRKREINPTNEGKKSVTMIWTGIGAFMLGSVVEKHVPGFVDTSLDVIGWGGTVGGAIYHVPATVEYCKIGFGVDDILPDNNN